MLFQCSMFGQIPPRRGGEERAKVFKFAAFSFYSSSPWQCLKSNKMHKDSNFSIWIINWASKGPIATNLFKRKCKSLESAEGKLNNFSMARGAPIDMELQIRESWVQHLQYPSCKRGCRNTAKRNPCIVKSINYSHEGRFVTNYANDPFPSHFIASQRVVGLFLGEVSVCL